MGVLLPDGQYTLRRRVPRPEAEDEFGKPVPGGFDVVDAGPLPGAAVDRGDGTFAYRLDPSMWPVTPDDVILGNPRGQMVVRESRQFSHSLDPTLDYVGGTAVLVIPERR
jgi:hypothetical protein